MPPSYTRRFRVRHYECDAYGHLNNVNYVRYMQETALDASADRGWDMARYDALGQYWIVRETQIEYLRPLLFNDEVDVTTWVANFRRVQSLRKYAFHRVSDGALVAQAASNWVFLEWPSMRPARIPQELMDDFLPEGNQETLAAFPEPAPPPDEVFRLRKRVEWRDIDNVGHANNAAYFSYFEDASTQVGKHFGWSMQRMQEAGFAMVMRDFRVQHLQPALMDDELEVACWLSDGKRASVIRHYTLTRVGDGELLARGRGLWVCFDLHRQRPMRIPQAMIDDFRTNISPSP